MYSLTSLLCRFWDLAEVGVVVVWHTVGVGGQPCSFTQVAFDPLLIPTITLFNLSLIVRSTPLCSPPNDPDSLSINSPTTRNISLLVYAGNSGGIYIVMCGIHIT